MGRSCLACGDSGIWWGDYFDFGDDDILRGFRSYLTVGMVVYSMDMGREGCAGFGSSPMIIETFIGFLDI